MSEPREFEQLERVLGHRFARVDLLRLALTHRSFVYDAPGKAVEEGRADPSRDNEQLEFMGDAALGLLAAEALCRRHPASREGDLTRMRAAVVSRKHLGAVGTRLGLGQWLRLGPTAERDSGRTNPAIFSNAVEALIAALYLDGGLEAARRFVETEVLGGEVVPGISAQTETRDFKTLLKERHEAEGKARPEYRLLEEAGPGHRRVFRVEVVVAGVALAQGAGSTKKQAQQEAARAAVELLEGTA